MQADAKWIWSLEFSVPSVHHSTTLNYRGFYLSRLTLINRRKKKTQFKAKNKFLQICQFITLLLSVQKNLLKRIHVLQVSIYTAIYFCSSLQKYSSSVSLHGDYKPFLMSTHKFSFGLRYGLWLGHFRTFTLLLSVITAELWLHVWGHCLAWKQMFSHLMVSYWLFLQDFPCCLFCTFYPHKSSRVCCREASQQPVSDDVFVRQAHNLPSFNWLQFYSKFPSKWIKSINFIYIAHLKTTNFGPKCFKRETKKLKIHHSK